MNKELKNLLQDESEDALLARIQEESLRYYNEVELPKRAAEDKQPNEINKNSDNSSKEEPQPHCSKNVDIGSSPMKDVFYKGTDPGAEGFHLAAGETYIYPTNYPIRKYQKTIIHSALFHNTLVSLPTGLGKTFIAAVVMYNYYRWFPQGKVVFMAPTKPLVAQQIRACHSIMAIPIQDTIEMTGTMNPVDRLKHWKSKRVFFLTPQVMANDLRSGVCPAKQFKCVVIDEAHRATKEYSFCHVIKELEKAGGMFRVLALSATPGSNVKAVIEVVQNLRISTLELRGEDSPDVTPYTHDKQIEPVSLTLTKQITDFMDQFLVIFERFAKNLRELRLITCNVRNLTKFQLLKISEKLRSRPPNGMNKGRVGQLISDLMVCIALAHGQELLQSYGLRAFYHYFTGCEDEENRKGAFTRLVQDIDFHQFMSNLQKAVSLPMDQFWSHPKHEHLVKILKEHFCKAEEQGTDTKVIIFCQYRVVVTEVYDLLQKIHPLIKPVMFIGQGVGKDKNGLPQKKQIEVMKQFREGKSNVMIATCVAEEGLDIGSVDLLMLMEVQRSPVRLVQRLGRTGRHRQGRCVVLLTQGKEVQKFHEAMATRKSFMKNVQNSKILTANLFKEEPTMVPAHLMPKMQMVHINVPERITPAKSKKQSDIRQALLTKLEDIETIVESPFLSDDQLALVKEELNTTELKFDKLTFTSPSYLYHRLEGVPMSSEELFQPTFSRQSEFNDWSRVSQQTYLVSHSTNSHMLCHMLNMAENMQLGEHVDINTQVEPIITKKKKNVKNKCVNDNSENIPKRKKVVKENKAGMDIRECMAIAADKVRLTQQLSEENDEVIIVHDTTNDNIMNSQRSPTQPNQMLDQVTQPNDKERRENLNCSLCKPPFNINLTLWKNEKCNSNNFPITMSCLESVELFVKNLTKDTITNIQVKDIFNEEHMKQDRERNRIYNIKTSETNLTPENIETSKFHDKHYTSPVIPDNSISYSDNIGKNVPFQNVILTKEEEDEYFNVEDVFNDDDDFDLIKESSNVPLKNSTPIKNPVNSNKMNSSIQEISKSKQDIVKSFDTKSSNNTKPAQINKKNIFKIPQLKLIFHSSKLSLNEHLNKKNSICSPTSKGVNNCNNSFSNLDISHKFLSPESPVLSGQISKCNAGIKLENTSQTLSPSSPILSSQITQQTSTCFSKLERKNLFSESKLVKEDNENNSLCKPLGKLDTCQLEEVDDASLISISQLFDDDSDEGVKKDSGKGVNLEQSSMYTISQMITKVSDLANDKKENTKNNVKNISKHINNYATEFESDDDLFDNIDLDATMCSRSELNLNLKSSLENKDSSNHQDIELEKECNVSEDDSKHESFTQSGWISCVKSPHSTTALKTSTPFSEKRPKLFIGSDIKSEIYRYSKNKSNDSKNSINSIDNLEQNSHNTNTNVFDRNTVSNQTVNKGKDNCRTNDSVIQQSLISSPFSQIKPRTVALQGLKVLSDSDSNSDVFLSPVGKKKDTEQQVKPRKVAKKVNKKTLFIEQEADVSGPPCSSDEENTSGLDDLDESFINDFTEQVGTSINQSIVDMQARYLQSVKSPARRACGFKIPVVSKSVLEQDVFSQAVEEDDSYENDSFCCDNTQYVNDDLSELEIAEQLLEKNKKSKKMKKRKYTSSSNSSKDDQPPNPKKRRRKIRFLSSGSSSEERSRIIQNQVKRKRHLSSSSSDENISLKKTKLDNNSLSHLLTSDSDSDRTI